MIVGERNNGAVCIEGTEAELTDLTESIQEAIEDGFREDYLFTDDGLTTFRVQCNPESPWTL